MKIPYYLRIKSGLVTACSDRYMDVFTDKPGTEILKFRSPVIPIVNGQYVLDPRATIGGGTINNLPRIVIANATCDTPGSEVSVDFSEITCPVGTTVSGRVEIQNIVGSILNVNSTFRMPMEAEDGRQRLYMTSFSAGVANIALKMNESGIWAIDEYLINCGLGPTSYMMFGQLKIFVYEV